MEKPIRVMPNTLRLLAVGFALTTVFRTRATNLQAKGPEPVILGCVALILSAVSAWQMAGEGAAFNVYGLTGFLASATLSLALLSTVRSERHVFDMTVVLSLLYATFAWQICLVIAVIALWPLALQYSPSLAPTQPFLALIGSIAWLAWVLLTVWRVGRVTSAAGPKRIGGWLVASTLAATFLLPTVTLIQAPGDDKPSNAGLLQMGADVMHAALTPQRATVAMPREPRPDYESLLYRQPEMLAASLATLQLSRLDQPELYFLGAAPYAAQGVFMREVQSIQRIIDERFGTAGRSLLLSSHRDTHDTLPLANRVSIDIALNTLGRVMNADKDVLLMYLTSHGLPGEVAVSMPGISSQSITPKGLRAALDRAGIKNRIIVVSACYAGSFIDDLADPNTAIFTAARHDRTSFGCSDERDWTYFGDALFNHALRETRSFTAAFDKAKALVAEWEAKQGLTPASEPQSAIGSNIAALLTTIETRPVLAP